MEEIAVAHARVAAGRDLRAAAQNHLIDHELAVVFAECALCRAIARVRRIGAARPLPRNSEGIADETGARRHFPLRLARQMLAGPARERVRFVIAHMSYRSLRIDWRQPGERERVPGAVHLAPIARRLPAFGLDRSPAIGEPKRGRRIAAV